MRPSRPVLAAALALLTAAPAASAGEPIMPLSEVRPGMRCTGLSVVRGVEPARFDVVIEDVVRGDPPADSPRLLVRVSGPAVDATGIGPGFSGSPVVCDGRIAGALSEAIGDFGGDVALATPIEAVLGEPVDPPAGTPAPAPRGRRPLTGAISVAGLAQPVAAAVRRASRGRVIAVPATAPVAAPPSAPLRPGSSFAAGLSSGDVTAGSVGTVTYVDGDRVWGFGHPLDAAGRRSLLLQEAYVYTVVGNPVGTEEASTYKLAAPIRDIGVLTNDGLSAVAGRTGVLPRTLPLRISARDQDTGRAQVLDVTLADERPVGLPTGASALADIAPIAVAQAAYTTLRGTPARVTARMCLRVWVERRADPLRLCNRYVGTGGGAAEVTGAPAAADVAEAAALVDAADVSPLRVRKVQIQLALRRGLALARMTGVRGPRVLRRGRTVALRLRLRRVQGAERVTRVARLRIPHDVPRGRYDLVLTGTEADDPDAGSLLTLGFEEDDLTGDAGGADAARTLSGLADRFAGLERWDGVHAELVEPGEVPEDPAGGLRLLRDPDIRISGSARLRIRVR